MRSVRLVQDDFERYAGVTDAMRGAPASIKIPAAAIDAGEKQPPVQSFDHALVAWYAPAVESLLNKTRKMVFGALHVVAACRWCRTELHSRTDAEYHNDYHCPFRPWSTRARVWLRNHNPRWWLPRIGNWLRKKLCDPWCTRCEDIFQDDTWD